MLEIKNVLKELRQVRGEPAVSIFVPTHRTFPDNEQDAIVLKNQLKLVEDRVTAEYDKRTAQAVLTQINTQIDGINHNYNLDTLAIFATPDQAKVLHLPFNVPARVIIGKKLVTRDFMREISHAIQYHILIITSEKARLIEAVDNRLIKEVDGNSERQQNMTEQPFPLRNSSLPTGSKADRTGSSDDDRYLKEFFNRVDKSLQQYRKGNALPVILVGDSRNLGVYETVCDNTSIIIGKSDKLAYLDDGTPQTFIDGVQEHLDVLRQQQFDAAKAELAQARDKRMVRTDLQMIYRSIHEGNAVTLLVRKGHSVPAEIDEENLTLTVKSQPEGEHITDDAVSELIELMSHNGGKIVFLPQSKWTKKNPSL